MRAGTSATGRTSTATTLYSGHEVLTSADWPISRLVRVSGKWKVVKTWPGSIRSVGRASIGADTDDVLAEHGLAVGKQLAEGRAPGDVRGRHVERALRHAHRGGADGGAEEVEGGEREREPVDEPAAPHGAESEGMGLSSRRHLPRHQA